MTRTYFQVVLRRVRYDDIYFDNTGWPERETFNEAMDDLDTLGATGSPGMNRHVVRRVDSDGRAWEQRIVAEQPHQ